MPRYAIILNGTVENIIVADDAPTMPSRTVVALGVGQAVSPGDTYSAGVFAPRVAPLGWRRAAAATTRLINGRPRLQQIRDQAAAASSGGAFANLAAASTAIRQIAGALADLSQNILDLELVAAWQQDNGQD